MNIFISYRFSGENLKELEGTIGKIRESLESAGHTCFCSLWHEDYYQANKFTYPQILEHALSELDKCDAIFAFVKSSEKSEGMLLEIGYALAKKKPLILAAKKGVQTTFLHQIADRVIEFEDVDDLCQTLKDEPTKSF